MVQRDPTRGCVSKALPRIALVSALTAAAQLTVPSLRADPVAEFYKGRSLRIVIGFGGGGSYDLYGRMAAEHTGRFIPGNPAIVPQNMPGGGSFVAAKYLFGAAPRDGTVLGMVSQTLALEAAMQGEKSGIVVTEMPYVGRMATAIDMGYGLPNARFKTFEDARRTEIIAGSSGGLATSFLYPAALNAFAGARFKIVTGYAGVPEAALAAERGEVEMVTGSLQNLMVRRPEWVTEKLAPILFQGAVQRHPLIAHVPTMPELGFDEEGRAILRVIAISGDVGRSMSTTPGVPKERLSALRKAFGAMIADARFNAAMAERRIAIEPADGEAMDAIARQTVATPRALLDRIQALAPK